MNKETRLFKPKELSKLFDVTDETLRRWEKNGKIKCITTDGGHRRYIYQTKAIEEDKRANIIYARVSSSKQTINLEHQVQYLQAKYPNYEVITDIASGLNFKRRGLLSLLDRVFQGDVKEIVVAHKDRLCRFGYDLIEYICQKHRTILKVDNNEKLSPTKEFADDVLSIITVFTARYYGTRKYHNIIEKNTNLSIN